jgi:methylenetetrahydrofolate--tRNA-(uracil-5-)-methyltransferase
VPPRTTAIGALAYYVSHAEPRTYQPTNITFGIMLPLTAGPVGRDFRPGGQRIPRKKADRKIAMSERALADLAAWVESQPVTAGSTP